MLLEQTRQKRLEELDPTARAVIGALDDDRFDFRTVETISDELELPEPIVQQVLEENGDLVRISGATGPRGERLFALRDRPVTAREKLAIAQTAVEKSVS